MTETTSQPVPCKCGYMLRAGEAKTVLWVQDQMILVENIPAMICDGCGEQYYDDEITEGLLRLTEQTFPWAEKVRDITVPVYTIKRRERAPESEQVWPVLDTAPPG